MYYLRRIVAIGNILFILWLLFNAMDERGSGVTPVQIASYLTLITLLVLSAFLIVRD